MFFPTKDFGKIIVIEAQVWIYQNNPMSENIFERYILKVNEFVECWEFLNNIL